MTRLSAWLLLIALLAVVCAAIAVNADPARSAQRRTLAAEGRYLAAHGAVYGSCYGCASERLKDVSRALVTKWFAPHGWYALAMARCVIERESAWNVGAVNASSGAAGLSQIEVEFHPFVDRARLLRDPWYAVAMTSRISRGGRDWGPWMGGGYACP